MRRVLFFGFNLLFIRRIKVKKLQAKMKTGHLPTVMPAQAGIQISAFRKYFKAAPTSPFHISARAGMTDLADNLLGLDDK
ncbi:hypothetical protein [Neisseria mucosa]|uniref:hypothetical protein n=1 Tax=Neisseria mucosa TaxID=488 RepID=UPI00280AF874|nr:hypothetical protein [Neisseria mucosa]